MPPRRTSASSLTRASPIPPLAASTCSLNVHFARTILTLAGIPPGEKAKARVPAVHDLGQTR
jgi:hypothetical protein